MASAGIRPSVTYGRSSRREFLRLAGTAGAVGLAGIGLAACGSTSTATKSNPHAGELRFRSQPDLVVPEVKVLKRQAADLSGHFFTNVHSPDLPNGPLLLDTNGDPEWFLHVKGKFVLNFKAQQYQGKPVLTWWEGMIPSVGYGLGTNVIYDDTYNQIATVQAAHGYHADLHDFVLTPQGTALILAYPEYEADLRSVKGPRKGKTLDGVVQEIDVATGALLFEWRSSDHIAINETRTTYGGPNIPFDYFHTNSVDVDTDGNLLISARNTWAVYKLDRKTGAVIWRMGGRKSDFDMGKGTNFEWQHDARRHADGTISIFDNGAAPKIEPRSRGLIFDVDESAMKVTLRKAYTNGDVLADSQGNMQELPDGHRLIGFGSEPRFTEFTKDGTIIFDAEFQTPNQSYRAVRLDWTGRPAGPPVAVARRGSGGHVTVYASWNGATEHRSWQVVAGPDPQHLTMVGGAAKTGFETAITVETKQPYLAAQAFDAGGKMLGTSAPVSVS